MIFKLVFLAVATSLVAVVIKESNRPFAVALSIAGTSLIFFIFTRIFAAVKESIGVFEGLEGFDSKGLSIIIKSLMIAYVTSFGCDICTDAGEKAIASALEGAGKAIMLSMAFPMLAGLFESVREMLGA